MKAWVVLEEDRGTGVSVVGVFLNETKANSACLSRQYVVESEVIDVKLPAVNDIIKELNGGQKLGWCDGDVQPIVAAIKKLGTFS